MFGLDFRRFQDLLMECFGCYCFFRICWFGFVSIFLVELSSFFLGGLVEILLKGLQFLGVTLFRSNPELFNEARN